MIDTNTMQGRDHEPDGQQSPAAEIPASPLRETSLHRNPFWLLGASVQDTRQRIVDLADERSLRLDHDVCQKARADLTNPRIRLGAEMAWLPGVAEDRVSQLMDRLLGDPRSVAAESGLPPLAHTNLMAAACELMDAFLPAEEIASHIKEMAYLAERISLEEVRRAINEDRAIADFPEIRNTEKISEEFADRSLHFRSAIKEMLNRLPTASMIETMTGVVESATGNGTRHAPALMDQLVDSYETECQDFLQKEKENTLKLLQAIRNLAASGEDALEPLIDQLERVARKWDKVVRPIQLSAKSRGIEHSLSMEAARQIRSMSVDLFNEHGMLAPAKRILSLLTEVFSETPEMLEYLKEDAEALQDIEKKRASKKSGAPDGSGGISYRAEVGLLFKDTLSIASGKVSWKGQQYALDAITGIRWGGNRFSAKDVKPASYFIGFGDEHGEAIVILSKHEIYSEFVSALWQGVGARMLNNFLCALEQGKQIQFGDVLIQDEGIVLIKPGLARKGEPVSLPWRQVITWKANGNYYLAAEDDKKLNAGLSYRDMANVRILDCAVSMAQEVTGINKLSELLHQEQEAPL